MLTKVDGMHEQSFCFLLVAASPCAASFLLGSQLIFTFHPGYQCLQFLITSSSN